MTADERIVKAVRRTSAGNRLTCEQAHALANELKVPLADIGRICNELQVKIRDCQLGCF